MPAFVMTNRLNAHGKQHAVDRFVGGEQEISEIANALGVSRRHVEQAIREAITGLVALVPKPAEPTDDALVITTEGDAAHG